MERERPWWQLSHVVDFRSRIEAMDDESLAALSAEIKAAVVVTQAQLQAGGNPNIEWKRRAKLALGFQVEKKRLISAELNRRQGARKSDGVARRGRCVSRARELLRAGDVEGAVSLVLDLIEG